MLLQVLTDLSKGLQYFINFLRFSVLYRKLYPPDQWFPGDFGKEFLLLLIRTTFNQIFDGLDHTHPDAPTVLKVDVLTDCLDANRNIVLHQFS